MSVEKKAFKGASWLASFRLITQILSWTVTIIIARILVPDDYGLMAMSTIITGYAEMFSELGIGAAIIQRTEPTQDELSSVFWFCLILSLLFAISCFGIAYPTAYIFDEPRVIPITKIVSVIFLINGLQIVPLNLLRKEFNFKRIGLIEMTGVIVSCTCMLLIASHGGGVWTLIGGRIILCMTKLILVYFSRKWLPRLHFNLNEAKQYMRFGILVAIGGSLYYIFEKSDRFFAGRAWSSKILGHYSLALQLSQIPTEKVVTLINQVSFSAFSRLQNDRDGFNDFYLNITKVTAILVLPIFAGGFLVGDELIAVLLDAKWLPITFVFRFLCLAQILTALSAVNHFVHTAQGRPQWRLYFFAVLSLLMSISFYFAVQKGFNAILIPWFSTYLALCIIWITLTLKKIGVRVSQYVKNLTVPFTATMMMSLVVIVCGHIFVLLPDTFSKALPSLGLKICGAALTYISFLLLFDREFLFKVIKLLKP